jgi:hypothetical protein
MESSNHEILLMLVPAVVAILGTIPTLIVAIAGYIKVAASNRLTRDTNAIAVRNEETLAEVKRNVDGHLTRAWDDAEKWAAQVNNLLGQIQSGSVVSSINDAKIVAEDLVGTAEQKASALKNAADLVASNLVEKARLVAMKVGPEGVKLAALAAVGEAMGEAVDRESAKEGKHKDVIEVRKLDET